MSNLRGNAMAQFRAAAEAAGWHLDDDGAFRHDEEVLEDGSPASFWYDGDWQFLCAEAAIDVGD
jgi:hypothetical protein